MLKIKSILKVKDKIVFLGKIVYSIYFYEVSIDQNAKINGSKILLHFDTRGYFFVWGTRKDDKK